MVTKMLKKGKVGILVIGHKEYWPQFANSRDAHLHNGRMLENAIRKNEVEVVTYTNPSGDQMVDTPELALASGKFFKAQDTDIVFALVPSYAASGRFMLSILNCGCPVVLIAFQKEFDIGSTTMQDGQGKGGICALPEAVNAMRRAGVEPAGIHFGRMFPETESFDERLTNEISEWCRVACCLRALKGAIFGSLGHTYEGMLDMNFDPTAFTRVFGIHVRFVEMCELVDYVEKATDAEIDAKVREIGDIFEFMGTSYEPVTRKIANDDVRWAARCAIGLDKLVVNNNLSGLAYYYEGLNNYYERVASGLIVGNSMLTSRGISLAGEFDMKTCVAMYIMSSLGCGGSFAEMGAVDFGREQVTVGHDGPHDIRIADGKPTIRALSLYHGKKGSGIGVEFTLKKGPLTMLGTGTDANGQFSFIVAEGESCSGPVPQTGNTWTRGYFGGDICKFIEDWADAGNCHHYALSIGKNGSLIDKLGKILNIPVKHVR